MEVLGVTSYGDLSSFAQQQSRASAFILSIDDEELANEEQETIAELRAFVGGIRTRNAEIPIFLHGETRTSRHIRTTSCASCTASSTCSRTRRSSSPATSCARRSPTWTPCRRPSSAR